MMNVFSQIQKSKKGEKDLHSILGYVVWLRMHHVILEQRKQGIQRLVGNLWNLVVVLAP
jgi:hypothetical protein